MDPTSMQGQNLPKVFSPSVKWLSPTRPLHIQLQEDLGMDALCKQVEEQNPKLSKCFPNN